MANFLICYDIANTTRLGKVHRYIVKHTLFIQFSVYYLKGDKKALDNLLDDLNLLIDDRYDDVRAYSVKPFETAIQIGAGWLPEGIDLHIEG